MDRAKYDSVAVLVPCYNEALTIGEVIDRYKNALPGAIIYVFDNDSEDGTRAIALEKSAIVRDVFHKGKGNVIRRMFADVDAEIYVLVDGDNTYHAESAPLMVNKLVSEQLDMVVGVRMAGESAAYRAGHKFGNKLLTKFMAIIFGKFFTDMLSGYRVFSRRFVKTFPAHSSGFETETELTIHALELKMPVAEHPTLYRSRPIGSSSKLNTIRDGFRILVTIIKIFAVEKPLLFFGSGFVLCNLTAVILAFPILRTFYETGLVPRIPTAILSSALVLLGGLCFACGIILDVVTRGRKESKRFAYLSIPSPRQHVGKGIASDCKDK